MSKPAKAQPLEPKLGQNVFIDVSAIVVGDVRLGDGSNIWPHTVLRGDLAHIEIGKNTNIQDLSLVHTDRDLPCLIGDNVTAGHQVCLHACTVGNDVLVGMGSIVLSGAKIEDRVILGAGSLVPEKKVLESGFLYFGTPVKKIRPLTPDEVGHIQGSAKRYVELAARHMSGAFGRIGLTAQTD